jgi:hypothetical protein
MTPAPEIDRTNNGIFNDAWIDDKQAHLDRSGFFFWERMPWPQMD